MSLNRAQSALISSNTGEQANEQCVVSITILFDESRNTLEIALCKMSRFAYPHLRECEKTCT